MAGKTIGIAVPSPDVNSVLSMIEKAEEFGVPAAWMTSGGEGGDPLTLFAAAAARTEKILLGTSILRTWSRHPVTTARQVQTIAGIAPGRFRLGIGPSHKQGMESTFGVDFRAPLGHLREYLHILRTLFTDGVVDFTGKHYSAKTSLGHPIDVPVMASALRPKSFEVCGAEADGAISWVCPLDYLESTALPTLKRGAESAGRPTPPLIVHAPVCVHENIAEAREGVRRQLGYFPTTPFYARMFATAGFERSDETGWTDEMIDSILIAGDEDTVARKLEEVIGWGASEILATVITVGDDADASASRTMRLIGQVCAS